MNWLPQEMNLTAESSMTSETTMPSESEEESEEGESRTVKFVDLKWGKRILLIVLMWFTWWNASKLPSYLEEEAMTNKNYNSTLCDVAENIRPKECFGLPTQMNLWMYFDIKPYYKLAGDQFLFIGPHCAMGILLEILLIIALWQGRGFLVYHSPWFLTVSAVFAVHILPAADGIPNSITGAPLNEVLVVLLLAAVAVGIVGFVQDSRKGDELIDCEAGTLLTRAWIAIGILINTAPLGEWGLILSTMGTPPESDKPHELSGHGFYAEQSAKTGDKWAGVVLTAGIVLATILYVPGAMYPQWWEANVEDSTVKGPALWQLAIAPALSASNLVKPTLFLQATGESFILMLGIAHGISVIWNPKVYRTNILRAAVGYNNLCVGFDSDPAKTISMPFQILTGILAFRFATLDTIRLNAMKDNLTCFQFNFARTANVLFATLMVIFPLLLLITPTWYSWSQTKNHFFIFIGALFTIWLRMTACKVVSQKPWPVPSNIWYWAFTFHTFALQTVGVIDVRNFGNGTPTDKLYTLIDVEPTPAVPWGICAYFDFGWFLLLGAATVFLPPEPDLQMSYDLKPPRAYEFVPRQGYATVMGATSEFGAMNTLSREDTSG